MRLIDADALDCALGAHYDKGQGMTRYQCAAILHAAPTVCCERCKRINECSQHVADTWGLCADLIDGCSLFESKDGPE